MRRLGLLLAWIELTILARAGDTARRPTLHIFTPTADCPSCDNIFSRLNVTSEGHRTQEVMLQERGEPRSGTGFMFEWAGGAMVHACSYLNEWFGNASCKISWQISVDEMHDLKRMTLDFRPHMGAKSARCKCIGVDRVVIDINSFGKHRLPWDTNCTMSHGGGMAMAGGATCRFRDHREVKSYSDLWPCVQDNICPIADDREQMVVFRDPRPQTVSAYFLLNAMDRMDEAIDDFVKRMLPTMCKWLSIRFLIFHRLMEDVSSFYWYEESLNNPLAWHRRWLDSVGLKLPDAVVEATVDAAMNGHFGFPTKGKDQHDQEGHMDHVSAETLASMDSVLRLWLIPELQHRFGLSPS